MLEIECRVSYCARQALNLHVKNKRLRQTCILKLQGKVSLVTTWLITAQRRYKMQCGEKNPLERILIEGKILQCEEH